MRIEIAYDYELEERITHLFENVENPKGLLTRIGERVAYVLQANFDELNSRPNKRGWRKTNFWNRIAGSTSFTGVDGNKAVVSIQEGKLFASRLLGATIRPKSGKYLAIPAVESRQGVSPKSADDRNKLFLIKRPNRPGGMLGMVKADGSVEVQYYLVRKAVVRREPDTLPPSDKIFYATEKAISNHLRKVLKK